jgi:hypothetical protein
VSHAAADGARAALLRAPPTEHDVQRFATQHLLPLAAACGALLAGPAARAAAQRSGGAGAAGDDGDDAGSSAESITARTLAEIRAAAAAWRALRADLAAGLAPQRAWSAQLAAAAAAAVAVSHGGRTPAPRAAAAAAAAAAEGATEAAERAWGSLLGHELPMEGLTRQMLALVGASATWTTRRIFHAAAHGGSRCERAWLEEVAAAHAGAIELCTHVQALVCALKLGRMTTFLTVRFDKGAL